MLGETGPSQKDRHRAAPSHAGSGAVQVAGWRRQGGGGAGRGVGEGLSPNGDGASVSQNKNVRVRVARRYESA